MLERNEIYKFIALFAMPQNQNKRKVKYLNIKIKTIQITLEVE